MSSSWTDGPLLRLGRGCGSDGGRCSSGYYDAARREPLLQAVQCYCAGGWLCRFRRVATRTLCAVAMAMSPRVSLSQ
eukprot:10849441-Alexandrium_andersonii.AAC.1